MEAKTVVLKGISESELDVEVRAAMSLYAYNPDGSDYVCAFCFVRPRFNADPIYHREDCFGAILLRALEQKDTQ